MTGPIAASTPSTEGPAVQAREETGRPLRADAERNRRRITEVAARLFARDGLEASFDDIAREAGVGVGTVYRRFPSREQLLQALFEDRLESMVALAEQAFDDEDPVAGLRRFAMGMTELHVGDRGLKELVFSQSECAERMVGIQERLLPMMVDLVARARAQGGLRPEVELSDVMMAVFMASDAGSVTARADPNQWHRQFAVIWAGLSATGQASTGQGDPLPGRAMTLDALTEAFNHGPALHRGHL